MYTLEIRKHSSGANRWWIWQLTPDDYPQEKTIRGFKTKTLATLFMRALQGCDQSAKKWYRMEIKRKLKETYIYPTEKDVWADTAQTAWSVDFSPDFVGADPNTYEPLK